MYISSVLPADIDSDANSNAMIYYPDETLVPVSVADNADTGTITVIITFRQSNNRYECVVLGCNLHVVLPE